MKNEAEIAAISGMSIAEVRKADEIRKELFNFAILSTDNIVCKNEHALFHIKREGCTVDVTALWKSPAGTPRGIYRCCVIELDLSSDPDEMPCKIVDFEMCDSFFIKLFEGRSHFVMIWTRVGGKESTASFPVSIPLACKHRNLVQKAIELENKPDQRARKAVEDFLKLTDAFDEAAAVAIAHIKAKKLPRKEELQRIAEFKEYASLLRERFNTPE